MEDYHKEKYFKDSLPTINFIILIILILAFGFSVYGAYRYANNIKSDFEYQLSAQAQANASANAALLASINIIEENLNLTKQQSDALFNVLSKEQQKLALLQKETEKIGGTVDTLEKLRQTDPELLKKYSKVFFLNENYVPARLSEIKNQYLYSEKETKYLLSDVLPFLTIMVDDALNQGVEIYIKSAYRSFNEQNNLKGNYTVLYGEEANQFSADQGYSEHQLGTTVDFITSGLGGELYGFGKTKAFSWLTQNAYKYGFVLSYPENNQYYIYEPWHWRFVGKALAQKLYNEDLHFYDLDQREIDGYLISIFD